jgi:hypothetical protein
VSTTVFNVTVAARLWASLEDDWCTLVVADEKGPPTYIIETTNGEMAACLIYFTVEDQISLAKQSAMVQRLPFNHFGRKNAGYLLAIMNGARVIYDTDDDNELINNTIPFRSETSNDIDAIIMHTSGKENDGGNTFNPYVLFGPNTDTTNNLNIWPRGLSLESIKKESPARKQQQRGPTNTIACHVQQFLANNDPDVDAIYRLTQPLPVSFDAPVSSSCYAMPQGVLVPYNSQATLHHYSSFWALLLPITVHGRVSDIWRGYFNQPNLWAMRSRLCFCPPAVNQFRNAHDYMRDFQAEIPLYERVHALIHALLTWAQNQVRSTV